MSEKKKENHTLIPKIDRKKDSPRRTPQRIQARSEMMNPSHLARPSRQRGQPNKNECETVEEEGERDAEDGLEAAVEDPPEEGGGGVEGGDDVEFCGGFADFAVQEGYLVGVCGYDLALLKVSKGVREWVCCVAGVFFRCMQQVCMCVDMCARV